MGGGKLGFWEGGSWGLVRGQAGIWGGGKLGFSEGASWDLGRGKLGFREGEAGV